MARAQAALSCGRVSEAETACERILRLEERFPPANFLLAIVAIQRGDRRLAIEKLRLVVNTDANSFEALEWLANLLREEGEFSEAMYLCGHMIRLRPDNPGGTSTMGLCHLDQGNFVQAIQSLRQAVSLASQVPVFHYHLARALEAADKIEDSACEYRVAISLAPQIGIHYEALGQLLFRNGQRVEAIANLQKAVDLAPTQNALLQLASALADDGRPAEAEQYLRRSIELEPEYAPAHEVFGQALEVLGRFDEAISYYQKAIELDPVPSGPYLGIARCRKLTEQDRPLVEMMERMTADHGRGDEGLRKLHYALGKAYNDLGEYEHAMTHYDDANRFALNVQLKNKPFDHRRYRNWIDRLIHTFNTDYLDAHRDVCSDSDIPIVIVGMIRSGTTLTEQIVSSHPVVGPGGEIKFWTDRERTDLMQKLSRGDFDPDELRATADAYLKQLMILVPGAQRVTDKMPLNYMALGLIHCLFPRAKIIHCLRDPVDTCLSIYITPYDQGAEFCYERASIVSAYREYSRLMEHWRHVLPPEALLEINYEELVADQEGVARRMIDFCGLEWDEACLRHEENERAVRTPSRWQVRQPVYGTSVERWRRYEPWLREFKELIRS